MANRNAGLNRQKSRRQHEIDGTLRKDRHSDLRTPEPPAGRPDMPTELDNIAQAEWDRMMVRLELSESLSKVDDAAIYQYCRLYSDVERIADDQVAARGGVKILEENIREVEKSELVQLFQEIVTLRKLVSKCTDQLRAGRMAIKQYLVEFGLTPASRGRIKLPPKTQEDVDEFTKFQRRGAA